MSSILLALFPLVALIAAGYLFQRSNFFADGFWAGAEKLNYYILFPALLFSTLANASIDFHRLRWVLIVMFVVIFIATAILYLIRSIKKIQPARFGVHTQSVLRFNSYISLALVAALFQQQGMTVLAVLLAVCIPVVNIISVLALTSSDEMSVVSIIKSILKNPLIMSCLVGMVANVIHLPIWDGLSNLLKLLAATSLPLGLLCVGSALQFKTMQNDLFTLTIDTFARLLLMPVLTYLVCLWFGLPSLETQILVLFFALPTASASYILTKVLKGDSQLMAAVISLQTLCAAFTLPLVIWTVGYLG